MRIKDKIIKSALAVLALGVFFVYEQNIAAAAVIPSQIDSFDSVIKMNADASVDITETIVYEIGSQPAFYIRHTVPVRYIVSDRGNKRYTLHLSDVSVVDAGGKAYEFAVSDAGGSKELKIGSKGVVLPSKNTYVIRYHLEYPINFMDDRDELFWNVTSDDWTVPIARASARVIYPAEVKTGGTDSEMECYAGPAGNRGKCERTEYVLTDVQAKTASAAEFSASKLAAGEGMAIVVSMPKDMVREPNATSYLGWLAEDFLASLAVDGWLLIFPFLVFLRMLSIWRQRGRDPEGRVTIVPEYDIPDGLSPAESGLILDGKCAQKEIVAEMIFLSQKGYLGIEKTEGGDCLFRKLKEPRDIDDEFDRELLYGIFIGYDAIKLSKLKGKFFRTYGKLIDILFNSVYEKGYFPENPRQVMRRYSAWALLLFFAFMIVFSLLGDMADAGIELPFSSSFTLWAIISAILLIVVIVKFSRLMPRRTDKGVSTRERILGFCEYLRITEKERLEFHDAPASGSQDFERFLPYAIALGVDEDWVRQFGDLFEPPSSDRKRRSTMSKLIMLDFIGILHDIYDKMAAVRARESEGRK